MRICTIACAMLVALSLVSCGSDNEENSEGQRTEIDPTTPAVPDESLLKSTCQIRYSLFGVSDDLLKFYHVTAEYLDADGQLRTEVIADVQWLYAPDPLSVVHMPEEFKCRIVAVRKADIPELADDSYEIGYGLSSRVSILNAKGEEVYKVKQSQPSSFTWQTDKAGMRRFLDSTSEIEIENFSLKLDKSEVIERLV